MKPGNARDSRGRIVSKKSLEPPPPRVEGEFNRLEVMRYVLNNPPICDKTEGERATREWLRRSPSTFMETLGKLEEAERAAQAGPVERGGVELGEADEALRESIEELIRRHAAGARPEHELPGPSLSDQAVG